MKLFAQRLGILAMFAGILFPTSVLSQTTKKFESHNRQQPVLLVQSSLAQQEEVVNAGIAQFQGGYQQLGATQSNPPQQIQIVTSPDTDATHTARAHPSSRLRASCPTPLI